MQGVPRAGALHAPIRPHGACHRTARGLHRRKQHDAGIGTDLAAGAKPVPAKHVAVKRKHRWHGLCTAERKVRDNAARGMMLAAMNATRVPSAMERTVQPDRGVQGSL